MSAVVVGVVVVSGGGVGWLGLKPPFPERLADERRRSEKNVCDGTHDT